MNADSPLDVVTVGESLGLLIADQIGSLRHVKTMRLGFGGAESNVAIGVARLGGSSAWIGRVGADSLGQLIVRELRAEGVEVIALVDDQAATALMLKERPRAGASRVLYYRQCQAGSRLQPSDIPCGVITRARILHVTGITAALGEDPHAAVHAAVDEAKRAGLITSFDVNHRAALWSDLGSARAAYRALAERADIVFAGEEEAALLTGEVEARRQVDALLALGVEHAVVKRGARGAIAASRGGFLDDRDAYQVPVIDTVGAGDAFVAGWLAEMASGAEIQRCLDAALRCGALACTAVGDWEAAPTREQLGQIPGLNDDPVSR